MTASPAAAAGDTLNCNPARQAAPSSPAAQLVIGSAEAIDSTLARIGTNQTVAYDERTRTTYVGYFDRTGTFTVAARDESGAITSVQPRDDSGPIVLIPNASDTHDEIALGFDELGGLHVAAGMHNSDMRYWRTTVLGDLASLTWRGELAGAGSGGYLMAKWAENTVTYPTFINSSDGRLFFTFRNGQSGAANTMLYAYDSASTTWGNGAEPLLFNGGANFQQTPDNYSAYEEIVIRDGVFHMVWVWRADPSATSNSRISYAWSRDLQNWYPMNRDPASPGTPLSLPFRYDSAGVVVDQAQYGGVLNGQVKIGFDAAGRVALSYFRNNSVGETKMFVARPTGASNSVNTSWRISDITAAPNNIQNITGDPILAGPDIPASSVYQSSWTGTADLAASQQVYTGELAPTADGRMVVPYTCLSNGKYENRQLVVKNTGLSGVTERVSDEFSSMPPLPASITDSDQATKGYDLAVRTTSSASFTVPDSAAWPQQARGTQAHWVLRWESGPYVNDNTWPAVESAPAGGTPLTLHLVLD